VRDQTLVRPEPERIRDHQINRDDYDRGGHGFSR
jgi:hypothetical protein